jgi:hypothetical protein
VTEKISAVGVSMHFINAAGTSLDDWTGDATQFTWMIWDIEQARTLKEQLCALLGEPGSEALLGDKALKAGAGAAERHTVRLERE